MTASFAPNPNTWYRLTNAYLGTSTALDVENDGSDNREGLLKMAPSGNYSGQYWRFLRLPSGTFKLYTMFLGENRVLDVYGDIKTKPHLATNGNYSGQEWTVGSWGDGTWKLSNAYSGPGLHLDTYADTHELFLGDGDHTGKHWSITPIESV
ncbi:hypothetical protein IFM46972_08915 [Aspergillus udagawae]|uniref:Ricin B lectin domain-containing protein n=1 Tax=Aspergillus udagawae TaxID=91492 RepID=A0A8H3S1U5_9EURO|nr:uncharacterized protein Aud_006776 [Aspergillus udagawae]GFF49903.1 hypothetical protein IFM46972_08915 [Aspergillus udagawae]GIC90342.1 hypothetical protein Aud_006776 [Aspergillus udagawae]